MNSKTETPGEFKTTVTFCRGETPEETVNGLTYLIARSKYINEHPDLYRDQSGLVIPTFEEEFQARLLLAQGCAEMAERGEGPASPYFSDLLRVYQAGFIAEYVWLFLAQPTWPAEAQPKNLPAFIGWVKQNGRQHVVKLFGGVKLERDAPETSRTEVPLSIQNAGGAEFAKATAEALADAQAGQSVEATRKVNAIHQGARALQTDLAATYVCFQNQRECNYFLTSHPQLRRIRVLDWCVANAFYLKAFLLSQERRFPEALVCLEELIRLAPLAAPALREQGFVLGRLGRPRESLAAYGSAWAIASRLPSNLDEAGLALRGMAVALVDLGELERAEKLLQDSLLIEPGNATAARELAYIARVKREGKPSNQQFNIYTRGLSPNGSSMSPGGEPGLSGPDPGPGSESK